MGLKVFSRCHRLNSLRRDNAEMSCRDVARIGPGAYKRSTEENDIGLFQRAALNRDLPKILSERQHDTPFRFREIQQLVSVVPGSSTRAKTASCPAARRVSTTVGKRSSPG
jgi:hypothetical protein